MKGKLFKNNPKGPIKIWVTKNKIVYISDMLDGRNWQVHHIVTSNKVVSLSLSK